MKCPLHILDSSAFCEKYSISELPLVVFMGLTVMPSQPISIMRSKNLRMCSVSACLKIVLLVVTLKPILIASWMTLGVSALVGAVR